MKFLKLLLAIFILLIVVMGLALLAVVIFINPNKLKPVIAEEVLNRTGYQLIFDGKFKWSFYPNLGVSVDKMKLKLPQESQAFIELQQVTIFTRLGDFWRDYKKLSGDVLIKDVFWLKVHAKDTQFRFHWQNHSVRFDPIIATLYNGTLTGSILGSEMNINPKWNFKAAVHGLNVKPLLQDISGQSSKLMLSGTGQFEIEGKTQGHTKAESLEYLNAHVSFDVANGILSGININYLVQSADALLNDQSIPAPPSLNQTNFSRMSGSFGIENGIAQTEDLTLLSDSFLTKGKGNINLPSETINFDLKIQPHQTTQLLWDIPVLIVGDLHHPTIKLDTKEIEKILARKALERIKKEVQQKIKKEVPGKTGEFLQNLLGP